MRQPGLFDFLAGLLDRNPPGALERKAPGTLHRESPGALPHQSPGTGERRGPSPGPEFVRHPRARRYLIRVRLDGTVRVTIPRGGSKREATIFYEQQRTWVDAQQRRVAEVRQRLPQDLSDSEQASLRARARLELPARLLELAAPLGLPVRRVSVRNQRHRWGSCSASGLICLNWRLVTMPAWVRDYVIYHELMHLKRMDHSPTFWKLVAGVCPNYQDARRWLRRHGLAPHAAGAHGEGGDRTEDGPVGDEHDC